MDKINTLNKEKRFELDETEFQNDGSLARMVLQGSDRRSEFQDISNYNQPIHPSRGTRIKESEL